MAVITKVITEVPQMCHFTNDTHGCVVSDSSVSSEPAPSSVTCLSLDSTHIRVLQLHREKVEAGGEKMLSSTDR